MIVVALPSGGLIHSSWYCESTAEVEIRITWCLVTVS